MPPSSPDEILTAVLGGVVILLLLVLLGAWAWALSRIVRGMPLLAERAILPMRPARWGGGTVSAMILLYFGVNLFVGQTLGPAIGLKAPAPPQLKDEAPAEAEHADRADERPGEPTERAVEPPAPGSYLDLMLLHSIASVLFLLTLPALLRRTAGVGVVELGLSTVGWPRQVGIGVVAALLATPAVYAIHIAAAGVWETNQHPVEQMMADRLSPGIALLAFVSTVVLAPLVEETMFRGVLLGWLTRVYTRPPRDAQIAAPVSRPSEQDVAVSDGIGPAAEPLPDRLSAVDVEVVPAAAASAGNVVCWPAIVLTSLLFAGLHAPQWPAPIGIFFLSMVLGVVYQRTGSLLTAMVLHGVFNGSSTALFLVGSLARSLQAPQWRPDAIPVPEPAVRAVAGFFIGI